MFFTPKAASNPAILSFADDDPPSSAAASHGSFAGAAPPDPAEDDLVAVAIQPSMPPLGPPSDPVVEAFVSTSSAPPEREDEAPVSVEVLLSEPPPSPPSSTPPLEIRIASAPEETSGSSAIESLLGRIPHAKDEDPQVPFDPFLDGAASTPDPAPEGTDAFLLSRPPRSPEEDGEEPHDPFLDGVQGPPPPAPPPSDPVIEVMVAPSEPPGARDHLSWDTEVTHRDLDDVMSSFPSPPDAGGDAAEVVGGVAVRDTSSLVASAVQANLLSDDEYRALEEGRDPFSAPSEPPAALASATTPHTQVTEEDAIVEAEAALARDPHDLQKMEWLAVTYFTKDQTGRALELYHRLTALEPDRPEHRFYLGDCYFSEGHVREAAEVWNQILEMDAPPLLQEEVTHRIAQAESLLASLDAPTAAAEDDLVMAQVLPDDEGGPPPGAAAPGDVAGILSQYRQGDGSGVEDLERQLALDPNNVEVLDWLGFIYYSSNESDAAIDVYGRLLRVDPDHVAGYYYLGNTLTKQGRHEEAFGCWEHLLSRFPQSGLARKTRRRLTEVRQELEQEGQPLPTPRFPTELVQGSEVSASDPSPPASAEVDQDAAPAHELLDGESEVSLSDLQSRPDSPAPEADEPEAAAAPADAQPAVEDPAEPVRGGDDTLDDADVVGEAAPQPEATDLELEASVPEPQAPAASAGPPPPIPPSGPPPPRATAPPLAPPPGGMPPPHGGYAMGYPGGYPGYPPWYPSYYPYGPPPGERGRLAELEAAFLRNPASAEAHQKVAEAYLDAGRPDRAAEAYKDLVEDDEGPQALYGLARALLAAGKTDEGFECIQTLMRRHPSSPQAEEALERFVEPRLSPGQPGPARMAAPPSDSRSPPDVMVEERPARRPRSSGPRTSPVGSTTKRKELSAPLSVPYKHRRLDRSGALGAAYKGGAKLSRIEEALDQQRTSRNVRPAPAAPPTPVPGPPDGLVAATGAGRRPPGRPASRPARPAAGGPKRGGVQVAIPSPPRALARRPSRARTLDAFLKTLLQEDRQQWLAMVKLLGGFTPDVLRRSRRLLEREPWNLKVREFLAFFHMAMGRHDLALRYFETLVDRRPSEARYVLYQGTALLARGDRAGARRRWREAVRISPRGSTGKMARALLKSLERSRG